MRILSTKILEDSIIHSIAPGDAEISCIAVIRIVPQKFDLSALIAADYDAIVFTSANGVNSFFNDALSKAFISGTEVYAISEKTTAALRRHGITPIAAAPDSASLADVILTDDTIKSVLHICGDLRMDTLTDGLEAAGLRYNPLVVYHTELLYPEVDDSYHAVLFFSPSSIDSFFLNNRPDPAVIYCAVGHTTGSYLRSLYPGLDVISPGKPAAGAMIQAVIEHSKATKHK